MIIQLKERLLEFLDVALTVPVHYGYPRTKDASTYVIIADAKATISRQRLAAGRRGANEDWDIALKIISDNHHSSQLLAEQAINKIVDTIIAQIAAEPRLSVVRLEEGATIVGPPLPWLSFLQVTDYDLKSFDSEAEGVIAAGEITLAAQIHGGST